MYGGLVRQYLHQEPADDLGEFAEQAGLALALEERQITSLANALGNVLAKALGGKK